MFAENRYGDLFDIRQMLGGLDFERLFCPLPIVSSAPVNGVKAAVEIGTSTSVCTFTAADYGDAGNDIKVVLADPGEETATESVSVSTDSGISTITVTMRSVSSTLSTGAQVETAVNADDDASALVAASSGGEGEMSAASATALTGGVDTSVGMQGDKVFDASYIYVATADMPLVSSDPAWKRVSLGSTY